MAWLPYPHSLGFPTVFFDFFRFFYSSPRLAQHRGGRQPGDQNSSSSMAVSRGQRLHGCPAPLTAAELADGSTASGGCVQ